MVSEQGPLPLTPPKILLRSQTPPLVVWRHGSCASFSEVEAVCVQRVYFSFPCGSPLNLGFRFQGQARSLVEPPLSRLRHYRYLLNWTKIDTAPNLSHGGKLTLALLDAAGTSAQTELRPFTFGVTW